MTVLPAKGAMPMDSDDSRRRRGIEPERLVAWLTLLVLGMVSVAPAWAQPDFPGLTGRVVDQAGILRNATEQAISDQLEAHEAQTTNQVVVVTVRSLQGYTIEEFGRRLGNHWAIGQAGRDNGVLLIVAPNEREVRIEVGDGLSTALGDRVAGTIIDTEIIPSFRRGNLERGVRAGTDAILAAIAGTYEAPTRSRSVGRSGQSLVPILVFAVFGLVAVMFVRGWLEEGDTGRRYRDRDDDDWDDRHDPWHDRDDRPRRRRRSGFRWFGGGSSSGGFRGGGGGFSGGGASGKW